MLNVRNKWGFTLVELMIVVSIIWVLAVTLLPQLQWAQARARDGWRIASLQNISAVLETYLWDNWLYPSSDWNAAWDSPSSAANCLSSTDWTLQNASLSKIFKWWKAPVNPQKTSLSWLCANAWSYQYTSLVKDWIVKAWYILIADVETPQKGNMNFSTACGGAQCDTTNLKFDWTVAGTTDYITITLTWSLTAELANAKNSVYWLKN
ncbi:MAG: Type IV pilin PilA [uncultured bacterium (gcode 4)]|uniref:Type IV pilin PilA n=1 Tax=uncultured bacterium (gcode 4) TaxID=1234023 RepID=K2BVS5_9BACT|nr:MAG: Type IV pilin PilA [uncultured bacterium (gcode 4)]